MLRRRVVRVVVDLTGESCEAKIELGVILLEVVRGYGRK